MSLNKIKNHKWVIQCADGSHEILLQINDTPRNPMKLYIDGQEHKTLSIQNANSLIPKLEYQFSCAGEEILLILYSQKADLVHGGVFQTSKQEYHPEKEIPKWGYRLFVGADITSLLLVLILRGLNGTLEAYNILFCTFIAATCILITVYNITSPFLTVKKKLLLGCLTVLWCWGLMILLGFGFSWIA